MPKMTDVGAGTVFRSVGGDQVFIASNATFSKRGTAIRDHRRHSNSSIPIPDKTNVARPSNLSREEFVAALHYERSKRSNVA
jgi:hypothetical protein